MTLSPELASLRDEALRTSCESWAIQKRWSLARGIDRAGPCPVCGGTDRFSIHTKQNVFNCRGCEISGSGVIELVMKTESVGFVRACEIVTGRSAAEPLDEKRAEAVQRQNAREAEKRDREAAAYRERARIEGHRIWEEGCRFDEAASRISWAYLREHRGIDLVGLGHGHFTTLRHHPELAWTEAFTDERGNHGYRTLHVGPALLAAVQQPDGRFGAVHMTWIDLDQPKGRLVLPPDDKGKPRPGKKVRGTKKGGAIRLWTPAGARRIVMGEGIETTGTALAHNFEADTAYWAGIDLGNMAGRAARDDDGKIVHDLPDMADRDCFVPPEWCEDLIYLSDSDEADNRTPDKLTRGLYRAQALRAAAAADNDSLKPLDCGYVEPLGEGRDLNDLVRVYL